MYNAYMNSLQLAYECKLESIAFPLLFSGNYGYPKEIAVKIAICAISDFQMEHDMLVYLVLYDRSSLAVSKKLTASIEEYIDNHYVKDMEEEFWLEEFVAMPQAAPVQSASERSLEQLMNQQNETFSQMLLRLIDECGLKDSYVYKKANVDRRHFSKIRNDVNYAPNKKTVMALR